MGIRKSGPEFISPKHPEQYIFNARTGDFERIHEWDPRYRDPNAKKKVTPARSASSSNSSASMQQKLDAMQDLQRAWGDLMRGLEVLKAYFGGGKIPPVG